MRRHRIQALWVGVILLIVTTSVMGCDKTRQGARPGPPVLPVRDTFSVKIPGPDRPTLGPMRFPGILVRMYRRSSATGLIDVHSERVADDNSVRRTQKTLSQDGWKEWPPPPAPELALGYSHLAEDSMDCGYLLHVTDRPTHWHIPPTKTIQCFARLDSVEKALYREEQISFHREREEWCAGKESGFPRVEVPENKRCNVRVILFAGEVP
jgi:hypothetical protein